MCPQFSSVTQLCPTLCDPMDCGTPSFPVCHQLLELTQTHVHLVGDAIQPSVSSSVIPFSCLQSFPASGSFPMSQFFTSGGQSMSFHFSISPSNEYSGLISFWMDCPRDSQEFSPTPQFKGINSLALSFLYSPTLTSILDYWKNHSFD